MAGKIHEETLKNWLLDDIHEEKYPEDLVRIRIEKPTPITPHLKRQSKKILATQTPLLSTRQQRHNIYL